jgi:hypothetical protein
VSSLLFAATIIVVVDMLIVIVAAKLVEWWMGRKVKQARDERETPLECEPEAELPPERDGCAKSVDTETVVDAEEARGGGVKGEWW